MNKAEKSYRNYSRKVYRMRPEVREREREYARKYRESHADFKEKHRESDKRYYEKNKFSRIQKVQMFNAKSCNDPVVGDVCKYNTLIHRMRNHKELYEGIKPKDCLIKVPTIKGVDEELKKEYNL